MPVLHLAVDLPDNLRKNSFDRTLLASKISEELSEQLTAQVPSAEMANMILRSPAFFSINTSFAICEFIKNSLDAGGNKLDFYVHCNAENVTCAVIDNGKGFPDSFLDKTDPEAKQQMVNYFENKLSPTAGNSGKVTSHIASSKTDDKNTQGGEGLGLATTSRILQTGKGKLEIGNVNDLPQSIAEVMQIDPTTPLNGAVVLISSPNFSPDIQAAYEKTQKNLFGKQDVNGQYLNYLTLLDMITPSYDAQIASPTASPRSNSEPNSPTLKTPESPSISDNFRLSVPNIDSDDELSPRASDSELNSPAASDSEPESPAPVKPRFKLGLKLDTSEIEFGNKDDAAIMITPAAETPIPTASNSTNKMASLLKISLENAEFGAEERDIDEIEIIPIKAEVQKLKISVDVDKTQAPAEADAKTISPRK